MIPALLTKYWRPLEIIIIVAACALWAWDSITNYGAEQYNAGHAAAVAEQKEADERAKQQREADKQQIQADAQQRIDAARNDAIGAAAKSGKLQQQIGDIRQRLINYSRAESISNPAASTGVLLSRVLSESIERNRALADYADRARESGITCERQYNSLRGDDVKR